MMKPVQSAQYRLSGEPGTLTVENNSQPAITSSQLRTLNSLITQISSLTGQTEQQQWTLLRQDIGLNADEPLLSRHFSSAEQQLSQRLITAQQRFTQSPLLHQISELINKNNNRQAISDYLNQHFGHASLHSLSNNQLRQLHSLLQDQLHSLLQSQLQQSQPQQGQSAQHPPQATARPHDGKSSTAGNQSATLLSTLLSNTRDITTLNQAQLSQALNQLIGQDHHQQLVTHYLQRESNPQTLNQLSRHQQITLLALLLNAELTSTTPSASHADKPLTLSEFSTLRQLITQLASTRSQAVGQIWQLLLSLSGVSNPQQIPQHHFAALVHWLLTVEHLTQQYFSEDHLNQQKPPLDLLQLQQQLKQQNPLVSPEHWQQLSDYAQQHWQSTPQTPLNLLQTEQLLSLLAQLQIRQQHHQQHTDYPQPIFAPLTNLLSVPVATLSSKAIMAVTMAMAVLFILWIVL